MLRSALILFALASCCVHVNTQGPPELWVQYRLHKDTVDTYLADFIKYQSILLTKSNSELDTLLHNCEVATNNTLDACDTCTASSCQNPPPPSNGIREQILGALSTATNSVKDAFNGIARNVGSFTRNAANKVKEGLETAVGWISTDAKQALSDTFKRLEAGLDKALTGFGSQFLNIANKAKFGVNAAGQAIGSATRKAAESIGRAVKDAVEAIGKFFSGIFSRRRRNAAASTIDAETLACYNKCPDCKVLTLTTLQEKIKHVCGNDVITKNATTQALAQSIISMSDDIGRGDIVVMEYDLYSVDFVTRQARRTRGNGQLDATSFNFNSNVPLIISGATAEQEKAYTNKILDLFIKQWTLEFQKKYSA